MKQTTNTLQNVSIFSALTPAEIERLTSRATLRAYPKNTVLVNEGDATDSLYVIQAGKVKIYLSDEEGKEIILNIQGPGEYFGEISLLDSAPRSASAMTLEDSRMYVIPKKECETFLLQNPELMLNIIKDLTSRLRRVTQNVKSLALQDVYGRVASTLVKLAETGDDGKMVVKQRLTHRDIAAMVGSSREMVSRIMKDLTTGGYITAEKNTITINERLPSRW